MFFNFSHKISVQRAILWGAALVSVSVAESVSGAQGLMSSQWGTTDHHHHHHVLIIILTNTNNISTITTANTTIFTATFSLNLKVRTQTCN